MGGLLIIAVAVVAARIAGLRGWRLASDLAGVVTQVTDTIDVDSDTDAWLRLRLELLQIESEQLVALRDAGTITTPLMNAVQRDLDLEVTRLQRRMQPA